MTTTSVKLPDRNRMPRVIQLAEVQGQTSFIFQQGLLTRIETTIDREEGLAIAGALINHFQLMPNEVAPITLEIDRQKTEPPTEQKAVFMDPGRCVHHTVGDPFNGHICVKCGTKFKGSK